MTIENVLGLVFAVGVMTYLVAALLFPDRMG
ncbi:MAG TPA: potassium-transporting ATPase subunit F [Euzebyales bacterium]